MSLKILRTPTSPNELVNTPRVFKHRLVRKSLKRKQVTHQKRARRASKGKTTLKKADKSFSDWIKARDHYTCVRCGKQYEPGSRNLTCSHFWGRGHKSTRFDPDNNDTLCAYPCHFQHWEKEKQGEYREFKLKQLGDKRYNDLALRAKVILKQQDAIQIWQDHLRTISLIGQ